MIKFVDLARKAALPLVAAAGLAGASMPASAMTAVAVPATTDAPAVTLVSGGCGIYAHRTVYGYCRPNIVGYRYGYRPYGYRPFGVYVGGYRFGGYRYGWHRWGWHRRWW